MPVRRRGSTASDDEADDDLVRQSPAAKRSRKTREETADSADQDEDMQDGSSAGDLEPKSEAESDESDELGDEDDAEAMEDVEAEIAAARGASGNVAEMGVIEKIEVVNFMCHDHLSVSLGPQINFIIGHNGSGKSAILTAITIALGGKASSTNRGNSLKSFVKEGKGVAQLELTLKNRGSEAFRHEQYGDKIIIERRINADGGGGWKLKSQSGRIVSTKKEELLAICDHANIQVDNPMNVLSQDAARQFLSSSHASQKYAFFLRGTQLSQLAQEYDIVKANIARIKTVIEKKREVLPELEAKARDAVARHEAIKKMREQRGRLDEMRDEFFWAQVEEEEKALERAVEQHEKEESKLQRMREKLAEAEAQCEEAEAKIHEIEERAVDHREREQPLKDQLSELRAESRNISNQLKEMRQRESMLNAQYKRHKATVNDLQARIDAETERVSAHNQEKRAGLARQRRDADATKREQEQQILDLQSEMKDIDKQLRDLEGEESAADAERESLRNKVQRLESHIRGLQSARSNRMTAYGDRVPELLRAIDQERGWNQKPVGPIGVHVKLKDMKWASVLESVIGNTLNAFCVTNHHDRRLLENLKQRIGCGNQVPTLTAADDDFDFSAGEPPAEVTTILRVLDINHKFVLRQLVNAVHIEKSALVDFRADGDALMRSQIGKRIQACFSKDLFKIGGGDFGSTTQTLNPHRGTPRLTANVEAQLQEAVQAHKEAEGALREANKRIEGLRSHRQKLDQGKRARNQQIQRLKASVREQADRIAALAEEMHEDEPASIAALVEAKKDADAELEAAVQRFRDLQDEKAKMEEDNKPVLDKINEVQSQLRAFEDHRRRIEPEMNAVCAQRLTSTKHREHWTDKIAAQEGRLDELNNAVSDLEARVESMTREAYEFCHRKERVKASGSSKNIKRAIDAMEKELEGSARRHGQSVEAIMADVMACNKAFMSARDDIQHFTQAIKDLDAALRIRLDKWYYFRRYIALRAKGQFTFHLSNRGYTGSLDFNHHAEKLKLRVQTEDSAKAARDKDPKSLSGGEKSFSTICLLLSLWEAIGCPIRCLDEFDVFMDAVNRKISMKMMIDTAKSSMGVQYVLITPQNMANTSLGPQVRVHRLADPERDQGTLT